MQKITWIKIYVLYWAGLIHTELCDRVKVKPECQNKRGKVRSIALRFLQLFSGT